MKIVMAIYHLAVTCWFGGAALFTFILTPTLFKTLNRDYAGQIVGLLFPGYFCWGLACGVVALLSLFVSQRWQGNKTIAIIVCMLVITAVQAWIIEPKAAELKKSIPSFETTPADHPQRAAFRRLHGMSMAGNLAVIAGGAVLVVLF